MDDVHTGGVVSTDTIRQFFDHLEETFEAASRRYSWNFDVLLGSKRVRVHFASPTLAAQLAPALGHIEAPCSGEPDLRICAWDGHLPDGSPKAPWRACDVRERGVVEGFNSTRFHVAFNAHSMAMSAADLAGARGFFWTPQTADLAAYEKAAPFRTVLSWYVQAWGGQLAHASAVAADGRCALVVGPSGAGKSTVALVCWMSGLGYLSDDYCAILPEGNGFTIASIFATAKLEEGHLRLACPELAVRERPEWAVGHEKVILSLQNDLRQRPTSARLAAIVVPAIVDRPHCELGPCSGGKALSALAPSSIFQTPGLVEGAFAFYARLAARFPCHQLLLGRQLDEIPGRMRQVLG